MELGNVYIAPFFEAFVTETDKAWMWIDSLEGIFYREGSGEITLCARIPWEMEYGNRLFGAMEKVGDKIVLVPNRHNYLIFYDVHTKEFSRTEIGTDPGQKASYMATWKRDKYVYAFGFRTPQIMKINMETEAVEYVDDWCSVLKEHGYNRDMPYFRNSLIEIEGKLFVPFYNANAILVYDLGVDKTNVITLKTGHEGFGAICRYKKGILLAPRNLSASLLYYSLEDTSVSEYAQDNKEYMPYAASIGMGFVEDKIIIYPTNSIYSSKMSYSSVANIAEGTFSMAKIRNDGFYVYKADEGILYVYNDAGQQMKKMSFQLNARYMDLIIRQTEVINEYHKDDLKYFIEGVIQSI